MYQDEQQGNGVSHRPKRTSGLSICSCSHLCFFLPNPKLLSSGTHSPPPPPLKTRWGFSWRSLTNNDLALQTGSMLPCGLLFPGAGSPSLLIAVRALLPLAAGGRTQFWSICCTNAAGLPSCAVRASLQVEIESPVLVGGVLFLWQGPVDGSCWHWWWWVAVIADVWSTSAVCW